VTARLKTLPQGAQIALVAGGLVLVVLVGYFAVIAPKKHTASTLKGQTANVQAEIDHNRSSAFTQALPAVRSASVFSLTKAMPDQLETPDVILQLNELAEASGISFDKIQPGGGDTATAAAPDVTAPFAAEPIQVKFSGSFYNLLTFLQRMRNLVRVQHGNLYTAGRLFDVSSVTFTEGPNTWPQVTATLVINEFVPQAPQTATTGTPSSTDTTSTTTTSNPTSAAPSTSGGS
jgi:Tfp pilus assembly protein PilO